MSPYYASLNRRLDNDTLKSLQTKVMKAFFHDTTIDKEGSFLNYFHQNLHRYISEPYREDASLLVLMKEGVGCIEIEEKFQYSCRKAGSDIQTTAKLWVDPGEYVSIKRIKVAVQYPYWHEKKGEWVVLFDKEVTLSKDNSFEHAQSLSDFKSVDGLIVSVESYYSVKPELFQIWQMAHPTKNFQISFSFPKEFNIQLKPLVLHPELSQLTINEGYAMIKYDGWMLPYSGVAWRFSKK